MTDRESVMTVFAGTNGAGKSTISFQMRDYVGTIIDPDQIAKRINPEDPRSADLSAGREAVKQIRELIGRKENFAIETTLSGSFVLRHMKTAKEQGYKVVMYYIGLQDVQMHIDRVASRVEQGGHWIAEEDIRWRYGQSLSNLKPALEISDEVTIIDNTSEPEVVAEIKRSQISFCRDEIPTWARGALELYLY
ncbi:zeta toxin family protein [Paenibacillus graminis]|uniref:zeta toxin family protein n=3 Tax=Paenibacillus TaxID=44249 RepID=UPI002DBA1544|nr:zeta toxin family protein [Paenibacillus graminis]MEC0170980.1 zeta toxin family protein [Paenibacillus graminis]